MKNIIHGFNRDWLIYILTYLHKNAKTPDGYYSTRTITIQLKMRYGFGLDSQGLRNELNKLVKSGIIQKKPKGEKIPMPKISPLYARYGLATCDKCQKELVNELHVYPFKTDINSDYSICNRCNKCGNDCAKDI